LVQNWIATWYIDYMDRTVISISQALI